MLLAMSMNRAGGPRASASPGSVCSTQSSGSCRWLSTSMIRMSGSRAVGARSGDLAAQAGGLVVLQQHAGAVPLVDVARARTDPVDECLVVVLAAVRGRAAHARFGGGEAVRRVGDPAAAAAPVVDVGQHGAAVDRGLAVEHLAVVVHVAPGQVHLVQLGDERLSRREGDEVLLDG